MICQVCGSTESYTEDGIKYCRECSVQFKSSQDESADESFSRKTLQSTPDISKAKKKKEKTYSPWLSTEAYNLILSKQVSALIKLGCSNKLKDVVLYIWAKYLQKCEAAFIKEHYYDKNKPRLSISASARDKKVLYGLEKFRKKPKTSLKGKSTNSNHRKKSEKVTEVVSKTDFVSDSETESHLNYSSGSDTVQEESTNSSSNTLQKHTKKKQFMFSSHARKIMKAGRKRVDITSAERCIHNMTLSKTLSFCHLGLLYTEDQLLLSDLIQLVNDGTVPFIDVTCHFPPSMQLQKADRSHFTRNAAPEIDKISLNSAKLVHFLKLPKFKPPSVLLIAARFVKDLNLPNDIIPVLKLLKDKLPERNDKWFDDISTKKMFYYSIPIYEVQAASLIVVALKMFFVLDGKYEVEHSEVMVKLNSITEGNKFFVWNEWQKQTSIKEYMFMKRDLWYNDISRLDSLIADRIIERHALCTLKPELSQLQDAGVLKDVKARCQTKILLDDLIGFKRPKKKPTSFPLQYELCKLVAEWKELHLFKDTSNIDFDFISKDFSHNKLFYKPSAFQSDQLIHLLLLSLYESVELLHVSINKAECHYRENIIRTSTKYWHLDCIFRASHPDFQENWMEELPPSFKWLIKFFCKYLQVDCEDLCVEIKYIEKKLFVQ